MKCVDGSGGGVLLSWVPQERRGKGSQNKENLLTFVECLVKKAKTELVHLC